MARDPSVVGGDPRCGIRTSCQDPAGLGLLSCLSHPLLMPPDGLCHVGGAADVGRGSERGGGPRISPLKVLRKGGRRSPTKPPPSPEAAGEAQQVGASLLNAIRAKNAPGGEDEDARN